MLPVYLILCFLVAWIGRNRMLRLWGNFILAFFISPLIVALILFISSPVRRKEAEPAKTTAG